MNKTIEIPDIAQWEETDSILAKNTIGRLTNEVRTAYDRGYCNCSRHDRNILERKHQQLEHIEQVNKKLYERIDKALELLDSYKLGKYDYALTPAGLLELEDILRGEE